MPKILELPEIEFITTPEGKLKSVVLSLEDWRRISETLKIMSSKELIQSIRRAKRQLRSKTKLLSLDSLTLGPHDKVYS
jgi:PHD/YefM family antitoxin component YafN of YafNO toxin-antitoxin module